MLTPPERMNQSSKEDGEAGLLVSNTLSAWNTSHNRIICLPQESTLMLVQVPDSSAQPRISQAFGGSPQKLPTNGKLAEAGNIQTITKGVRNLKIF